MQGVGTHNTRAEVSNRTFSREQYLTVYRLDQVEPTSNFAAQRTICQAGCLNGSQR